MLTRRTRESGSAIRFETDAADRHAAEEGQEVEWLSAVGSQCEHCGFRE